MLFNSWKIHVICLISLGTVYLFPLNVLSQTPVQSQRDSLREESNKVYEDLIKETQDTEKKPAKKLSIRVQSTNLELEYEIEKNKYPNWNPSEENTFDVKEIRFEGNTEISSEEIFRDMPVIYNEPNTTNIYSFYKLERIAMKMDDVQKISLESMEGLTKYLVSLYEKKGLSGVYVYIPAESNEKKVPALKDGILTVIIKEALLSKVNIDYYRYDPNSLLRVPFIKVDDPGKSLLKESVIRDWSPAKENQMINIRRVQEFCNILNLNPDRYVQPIVSKSQDPNKLDIYYRIYEQRPWHFYVQSDNSGSEEREWNPTIGLINTNLTGRDDKFAAVYQGPIQKKPMDPVDENYAVFGSYDFPLFTPRLRLTLFAGHSDYDIDSNFPGGTMKFLGSGDFSGGVMRFNLFQTEEVNPWFLDIKGSLSYEESTSDPSLGLQSDIWWDLWGTGIQLYRYERTQKERTVSLNIDKFTSFDASDKEKFSAARTDANPDFSAYSTSAACSQFLDNNKIHKVLSSFKYLWSDERLVPAKMTSFGGLYTVRGYEEDEVVADGGLLFSAQYEFDLVRQFEPRSDSQTYAAANKAWLDRFALLTFTDIGRAKMKDPVPGEKAVEEMASVGLGLTTEIAQHFDASVYYGIATRGTEETDSGDGRWNFIFVFKHQF
jgi:hemolysin activation/secretion protein